MNRNLIFPVALLIISLCGCNPLPDNSVASTERIVVGAGPEDMVLDTLSGDPRLIISCSARRESHKPYDAINTLNLLTGSLTEMKRYNEPDSLKFHPHGIYLEKEMLYIVSHEKEPDDHPILIYRMDGDSLEFQELISTDLQHSPNALVTGPRGEIYFVNDSGKRGSLLEKLLKLKRASVVRLQKNRDGKWEPAYVAKGLGYPSGINRMGEKLFVGDAILHRIHEFNITCDGLVPVKAITDLTGNDNLRIYQGKILVPGHTRPFRFIRHAKDPHNLSPVEVYLVDPESGQHTSLFRTDGSAISGGSTAIIYRQYLYISQVFDPFILKVDLEQ